MRKTFFLLALGLLASACTREQPAGPESKLTPPQFMEIYVSLRGAQATAKSPVEYEQLRDSILKKARVTPKDMNDFVVQHSRNVKLMSEVWDSIQNRIDRQSIMGNH